MFHTDKVTAGLEKQIQGYHSSLVLSASTHAQNECYLNVHYSASSRVNTSGSEISAGAFPCMHMFAANQPFKKQLEEETVEAQELLSSPPHMWNTHVVLVCEVGECDTRGSGECFYTCPAAV